MRDHKMRKIPGGLIPSALLSSFITFTGWAAWHFVPQKETWNWVIYPGVMLSMPGGIFAAVVATIFSPQGGHGADDFSWLIIPVNLVFYFALCFLLLRRRR